MRAILGQGDEDYSARGFITGDQTLRLGSIPDRQARTLELISEVLGSHGSADQARMLDADATVHHDLDAGCLGAHCRLKVADAQL
jgi:hypothetical protein